jgi:hypothetical protein
VSNELEEQQATHITLPRSRYMWLLSRLDKLLRLEMNEVDTWQGYKAAMQGYKELKNV